MGHIIWTKKQVLGRASMTPKYPKNYMRLDWTVN